MSSVVYYRFRSSRQPQRLAFDGTGISVFDFKRGILLAKKLDTTADSFVLKLENPDTHETYDDDSEVIPRSTSVEVRRLPVARAGSHDSAAKYVSGTLVVNAKNAARREDFSGKGGAAQADDGIAYYPVSSGSGPGTEEDMMNAMFASQGAQWSRTQQEMASKTPVYFPSRQNAAASQEPDKTLPPGYICHRCGQKGHWITQCPSLYDPNWETKKVRRTTGIPKAMLRTVEKPADEDDGKTYLMNADGEYVVAVADDKSWADFQSRQQQQQARARRAVPEELQDPLTHELMRDPRKMPCCGKTYADASIENALIQSDFKCPNCGAEDVYIDQLEADNEMSERLREFTRATAGPAAAAAANAAGDSAEDSSAAISAGKEAAADVPGSARESDESDYEPDASYSPNSPVSPEPRKRRRSSLESVGSRGSDSPPANGAGGPAEGQGMMNPLMMNPLMNPMMMPFGFNPFMMQMSAAGAGTGGDDSKMDEYGSVAIADDDEPGDDQAVVGRIR